MSLINHLLPRRPRTQERRRSGGFSTVSLSIKNQTIHEVDVKNQSLKASPSNSALRKTTKDFVFIYAEVKVSKTLVVSAAGPVSCASVCSHPGLPVTWMIHASVIKEILDPHI